MLNNNVTKIRRFLLEQGFYQEQSMNMESGTYYKFLIPDSNTTFIVDIQNCKCDAHYPDFKYNRANPYSTKESIVTFEWQKDNDQDSIIKNLENFFERILNIIKQG